VATAFTLLCPPLFYVLAAEKERLKALKQWCRLKSNRVHVMLRRENDVPGPTHDGSGPTNVDIELGPTSNEVEAAAGQSSGEGQDRGSSPSQAGPRYRGPAVILDPSLLPNYINN
jgi:hypothetical protein